MMERALLKSVILCIVLISVCSCGQAPEVDVKAEKARIEEVVKASIGWALTKDTDLLYSCFAKDEDLFWFTPEAAGTTHGFESFKQTVENVFLNDAFKAIRFEVRDLRIRLSRSGDVAWYSSKLDDENEWNGQPASWINVRWTGVLEKREGKWMIVQMHFSYGTGAEGN
jgi:ketosteroid isomerase-like protein